MIPHNAPAKITDGPNSMQEILQNSLPNLGRVDVSRSTVNGLNGGYTWTITFLRDSSSNPKCSDAEGCPNAGNVPSFTPTTTNLNGVLTPSGANAAVAVAETIPGNTIYGSFDLSFTGGSTRAGSLNVPYDATSTSVKAALESLDESNVVFVSRTRVGNYGAYEWLVTFVDNNIQGTSDTYTPYGAGNMPLLTMGVTSLLQSIDGVTNGNTLVEEVTAGSVGMSGSFTIDVGSSAEGPQSIAFDEDADHVKAVIESLSTVGDVHVERVQLGSGWSSTPVSASARGGYKWTITFLRNPGAFDGGVSHPPGSGIISAISHDASALLGSGSEVDVAQVQVGSVPLGGKFKLSLGGSSTAFIDVISLTNVALQSSLLSLTTVGPTSVTEDNYIGQALPGTVSVVNGQKFITTTTDLRNSIAPGDLIRIGSTRYRVGTPGVNVQTITVSGNAPITGGSFSLSFGGQTTACIAWNAPRTVIEKALEDLGTISSVVVTRSGNGLVSSNYGYVFTVSFTGEYIANNGNGVVGAITVATGSTQATHCALGSAWAGASTTSVTVAVKSSGFQMSLFTSTKLPLASVIDSTDDIAWSDPTAAALMSTESI